MRGRAVLVGLIVILAGPLLSNVSDASASIADSTALDGEVTR